MKIALMDTDAYRHPYLLPGIIESESYRTLQEYIQCGRIIADADPLWDGLYTTIILIKCGVTPMQMTGLLGKSKGAISSRRESLCTKILGEKVNQKAIDTIIRSL